MLKGIKIDVVSFTGRRGPKVDGKYTGITQFQSNRLESILRRLFIDGALVFVHGDCVGADEQAHYLALKIGYVVHKRPCDLHKQRAYTEGGKVIAEPENPLVRNTKIVDDGQILIACPSGRKRVPYSGTWHTIGCAQKKGREIIGVYSDGSYSSL